MQINSFSQEIKGCALGLILKVRVFGTGKKKIFVLSNKGNLKPSHAVDSRFHWLHFGFQSPVFQIPLGKHRDERYFQDFEIWILFVWGDLLAAVVVQNVLRIICGENVWY